MSEEVRDAARVVVAVKGEAESEGADVAEDEFEMVTIGKKSALLVGGRRSAYS